MQPAVQEENVNLLPEEFLSHFDLSTESGKDALVAESLKHPQEPCPVLHKFAPGLYIREIFMPKGLLVTGAYHKKSHLNMFLKGKVQVINDDNSSTIIEAPMQFIGAPGRKIGVILEDTVWQNIYATEKTDVAELEAELFGIPDVFTEFLLELQENVKQFSEADRLDYLAMLQETGWTEEEVSAMSQHRSDCIPFPIGVYMACIEQSPIHGEGYFASANIEAGTLIAPARIQGKRTPAGYKVNHSATPNAIITQDSLGDLNLYASEDIQGNRGGLPGQEITLDYRQVLSINTLIKGNL